MSGLCLHPLLIPALAQMAIQKILHTASTVMGRNCAEFILLRKTMQEEHVNQLVLMPATTP